MFRLFLWIFQPETEVCTLKRLVKRSSFGSRTESPYKPWRLNTHFRRTSGTCRERASVRERFSKPLQRHLTWCHHLIVHHPAHVFEVAVVEESGAVEFHPQTQFLHADGADLRQNVPAHGHISHNIRVQHISHSPTKTWKSAKDGFMCNNMIWVQFSFRIIFKRHNLLCLKEYN